MNPLPWLLGGLLLVLILGSLGSVVLRRRARSESARATAANVADRVRAWWVMGGLFAACALLGTGATLLLFFVLSFVALREFVSLTPTLPEDNLPLVVAFYALLPLQYALIWWEWYGLFAILIPVYGFLLLPSLMAMKAEVGDFLHRSARLQWALVLAVYCLSHAPALLVLDLHDGRRGGLPLLFFLLAVTQFSDVMQYVAGKLWGRRKLAPSVSPNKTWEGLLGGGAAAVALGAALWWATPFTPLGAAAMALVLVVMGVLGGLALSAVKRSLGVKDWGSAIQGHGGVLDRLDGVCFAAPVFFHLTRYFLGA